MALTPVDIQHIQFKPAFKGYNKSNVDEFVRSVSSALEEALKQKSELQRKVDMLEEEVDRVKKIESTMTSALTLAQKTADELKTNAHRQAEMILQEAEQSRVRLTTEAQKEAEKYRSEIALLGATKDRFETEFRAMLSSYLEWMERHKSNNEAQAEVA